VQVLRAAGPLVCVLWHFLGIIRARQHFDFGLAALFSDHVLAVKTIAADWLALSGWIIDQPAAFTPRAN
jgi:hypothetical protein